VVENSRFHAGMTARKAKTTQIRCGNDKENSLRE
jgi:hypothetical protein